MRCSRVGWLEMTGGLGHPVASVTAAGDRDGKRERKDKREKCCCESSSVVVLVLPRVLTMEPSEVPVGAGLCRNVETGAPALRWFLAPNARGGLWCFGSERAVLSTATRCCPKIPLQLG